MHKAVSITEAAAMTVLIFVLQIVFTASGYAEEKLVAPPFPGALRISPPPTGSKNEWKTPIIFGAQAPHDKVEAFYVPKHARQRKGSEGQLHGDGDTVKTWLIVHSDSEVLEMIQARKGDFTLAHATEVVLEWQADVIAKVNKVNRFFQQLDIQAQKFKGHDAELAELKKKYAYLKTSYYLDKKDEEILFRCSKESGSMVGQPSPDVMAEYQAQVKKLMEEKRYQEIGPLHEKIFGGSKKKADTDQFGVWKQCLADLAAVSYQTKVTIDHHPNQWDTAWK